MIPLTVGSLFSGIGGFEFGLERAGGFKTVWQCEIDPFCLKVLEKHWPGVKRFADIKKMGVEEEIPHVDVVCGGFPCQPVSCAGKRKGKEDERWLWPEFCRVVCCVRPEWVLIENVPGLLSADAGRLFAGILRDLSESGYDAEWNIVSAASVGAPHLRKRVFIVAKMVHSMHIGCNPKESRASPISDSNRQENRLSGKASPDVADTDSILSKIIFGNMGRIKAVVEAEQGIPQPGSFGETPREIADTESVRRGRRTMLSKTPQPRRGFRSERDHSWSIEPDVGGTLDGFSAWLDGHLSDMLISHKRLMAYGVDEDTTSKESRSRDVLRILRDQIREESNQRTTGGLSNISEKEVLLAYLCKLSEASEALDDLSLEGKEAQEDLLRSVPGQNESSGTSHRSKSREQRTGEHTDALQEVSRLLARDSQTTWASYRGKNAATILSGWLPGWEDGIPRVANGVPDRVDRIRALGNAIVPQCAQFVGQCLLDSMGVAQ